MESVDYVVATIIFLVPLGIGIVYAIKDAHKATRDEYLLGGRQMSLLPVASSLFITFQSATSQVGIPTEVYSYGFSYVFIAVGFSLAYVVGYFTIVPLMYPLQITSIYEYLKLRYNSELVRMFSVVVGMVTTVCYMAVALLSPALALEATVGIPLWISIIVTGAVGTVYTSLGGIKSVIWTDAFQTVIVFIGIFAIIITACMEVGGISEVWNLASDGGRTSLSGSFSPDPRIRGTVWALLIGNCVTWIVNCFNQATLQRICCMRSLRSAKMAFLLNIPLVLVYIGILCLVGTAVFAYFSFNNCDPVKADFIGNRNQLAPFFVVHAMNKIPGMTGLYISALFCGALSTLSSGINSLAANTVEDVLRQPLRSVKEATVTFFTKLIVLGFGGLIITLAYAATSLGGTVTQMGMTVFACFGTPILGIFLMGGMVPWANKIGALCGAVVSLALNLWISLGNRMHGPIPKCLPPPSTHGCDEWAGISNSSTVGVLYKIDSVKASISYEPQNTTGLYQEIISQSNNNDFFLYAISYEWYSLIGTVTCVVVGLSVSYISSRCFSEKVSGADNNEKNARYIFPLLRRFWNMEAQKPTDHSFGDITLSKHILRRKEEQPLCS